MFLLDKFKFLDNVYTITNLSYYTLFLNAVFSLDF